MADSGRLDELKRKFDENPRRYFAPLANEYRKAGDAERAIELCRTYLPQQPTHMSGYIVYGQALFDADRTDEAAAVFQQALTLDPENIIALRYLGDIARSKDDRPAAIRWYGKVLELDPRNDEVTNLIADLASPDSPRRAPGPERPVPPTIRPEPEDQGDVLALEELMALPDAPQAEIILPVESPSITTIQTADESVTIIRWPNDEEEQEGEQGAGFRTEEPVAGASVESMMDFGLDEPFAGRSALETPQGAEAGDADDESPVAFGGSPLGGESYGADDFTGEPLAGGDLGPPPEAADESPLSDESEGPERHEAAAGSHSEASTDPVSRSQGTSPFVTETMAELYVAQGMNGEAIAIYRELVERRDDPRLRSRLEELESAQQGSAEPQSTAPSAVEPSEDEQFAHAKSDKNAETPEATGSDAAAAAQAQSAPAETVRDFFARIGARRADAAPHISADGESGLSRLFGGASLDSRDVGAAQSLAGAFTSASSGDAKHGA